MRSISLLLVVAATACGSRDSGGGSDAASRPLPPAVVSYDGFKGIVIGAIPHDTAAASNPDHAVCRYIHPTGFPAGVTAMLSGDTVVRIDVDSAGVATPANVQVGDSEVHVMEAYRNAVVTQPHKYVEGGHYLIVTSPVDTMRRGVFETDGQKVVRYRFGRRPEVDFVEGCG